jgi:hypothetical protein
MQRTALLAVSCSVLLGSAASGETTVATSDSLALQFSEAGELISVQLDGRDLPAGELIGGFFVTDVGDDAEELIDNGSLERDEDGDGVPDGFSSGGVWERDNTVARTGQWSMKADIPGEGDGMSGSLGIVAPVEGGATYLASFWLKCERRGGSTAASTGYLQQQDEAGERTTEVFQHMMSGSVMGTSDWRPVRMLLTTEGDTRRVFFRTDIYRGYGTLWADDFALQRVAERRAHLPTRAEALADGVRLSGGDAERELRVEATWEAAGEMLKLEGKIVSTAERERCIRLSYRIPTAIEGGTWGSDIDTSKTIEPGGRYNRTTSFGEFGPYSIYPFSSVVTSDEAAGLSLAVPMHPPRPFRLSYAADQGLVVEWDFALSSLPELFPRSADFFAVLYRHDPQWGFRAAADKYYRLFPEYFSVRVPRFGNWYYCNVDTLDRPEDFGLAYNEMTTKESVVADRELGCVNFAYTEPWGWWGWALGLHPSEDDPVPTRDEMIDILNHTAADEESVAKAGLNPTRVAHTILNSGVWDKAGKPHLHGYVAKWGGYNWHLNASPHAADEGKLSRFQATYEWEIEPKLALGVDGIYLDSIVNAWAAAPNYRPEHLKRTRHPLTFASLDATPAQLGVWNHYEFTEHLSRDLHGRGKLLMANIFPYHWVFFNHLLDVMGHEVWGADNLDKMRAERTLAYHKPYTWLMQQGDDGPPEAREQWMQAAMLYGIAPNIVGGSGDAARYERWRPLYREYMPIIIALCEAGWEPVTHASAEPGPILLERFGPREGRLYFTARNPGDEPVETTITVDTDALGVGPPKAVTRLPDGRSIPVAERRFKDRLEAGTTCAYRIIR